MTLITYPTRVHFADDVLEEALHSELERVRARRVLLVCDRDIADSELADRVMSGLLTGIKTDRLVFGPGSDLRAIAAEAVGPHDTLIAFGSAQAIELGRNCRYARLRQTGKRPHLFAVPGVDGLPDPCPEHLESPRAGLPSVLICDPTVALDAGQGASVRASIICLIRCVESYLAHAYNPPADGMALDGLCRCVITLPKIGAAPDIAVHRELMAACLNAALSQEKGLGPTQRLSAALARDDHAGDLAAIARLLLPGVLRACAIDGDKAEVLRKVLGEATTPLDKVMQRILSAVPMPASLADLGISRQALDGAARSAAGTAGLTFQGAREVLEAVYQGADA
jgi:alcohol dehydrogenase class IV